MVESEISAVNAMKAYRGSRGVAPLIINLGRRWMWVVKYTPRPLYPLETKEIPVE
jgi:hypothetical protein